MKITALNTQNNSGLNNQSKPAFGMHFSETAAYGLKESYLPEWKRSVSKILDTLKRLRERNDNYVFDRFLIQVPGGIKYPRIRRFVNELLDVNYSKIADFLTVRRCPTFCCRVKNEAGSTLYDCHEDLTHRQILRKLRYLESPSFDKHAKKVEERGGGTIKERVHALTDMSQEDLINEVLRLVGRNDKQTKEVVRKLIAAGTTDPKMLTEVVNEVGI